MKQLVVSIEGSALVLDIQDFQPINTVKPIVVCDDHGEDETTCDCTRCVVRRTSRLLLAA